MKLAFVGANGHRYLASLLKDAQAHGVTSLAVAGDGLDDAQVRAWFEGLKTDLPCQWFDDAATMYDRFAPDAVNIGVRYAHNGRFIAQALERDVKVCSDKPIAGDWRQLDRLHELVHENPDRVVVSEFPLRCSPAFVAAKEAVQAGRIGQVVLATAQKSYRFGQRPGWYADRADYGGTLLWVASHALDYVHYVTGLRYTSASGVSGNVSKLDYGSMEEYTLTTLTLEGGGAAVVHADFNRPESAPTHGDDRLRVVGSLGQVEVRDGQCTLITRDQPPVELKPQVASLPAGVALWRAMRAGGDDVFSTRASLEMAAVMLAARDATDQRVTLPIAMG